MENQFLKYALYYRNTLQWSVIPLNPKNKLPLLVPPNPEKKIQGNWPTSWSEYENRLATEEEIREWWTR